MIVHEQLSFQDALSLATKRIFETKGRSRRSEFWWAMLVAYFISNFLPPFWLVTIPISIRRLHDTGRSGWWMFFPVVATIIIVLMWVSRNLVGINFRHPNVMPNFAVWKTITYRHWHRWCCQPRF